MEDMEILNQIIEAERGALRMAGEAKAEQDNLPAELLKKKADIHSDYLARADARIQVVRELEAAMTAQREEQMDTALSEELYRLDVFFDTHRDEMIDRLFSLVVEA